MVVILVRSHVCLQFGKQCMRFMNCMVDAMTFSVPVSQGGFAVGFMVWRAIFL